VSGVAIRSFQASSNITKVIANPATKPASNPHNAALLLLSERLGSIADARFRL
jgi:hypothetical protein